MQYKKIITLLILAICIIILKDTGNDRVSEQQHIIMISNSEDSFVPSKYSAVKLEIEKVTVAEENVTSNVLEPVKVNRGTQRYPVTEEEFEILCRIAASETTEGNLQQKMNAVQTILNRVKDSRFPNTIKKVVFAENQFSVIDDGRYYSEPITNLDRVAVQKTLENPTIHNALFFEAVWSNHDWFKTLKFEFNDGIHKYYSN